MTTTPIDTALRSALAARIDRGETIYAIAKGAGISWPVLNRYLSGERSLNLASADKLAAYLGLRVAQQ